MEEYTQILASKDQQIESLKAENQVLKDRLENHPGIIVDGESLIFIFLNFQKCDPFLFMLQSSKAFWRRPNLWLVEAITCP